MRRSGMKFALGIHFVILLLVICQLMAQDITIPIGGGGAKHVKLMISDINDQSTFIPSGLREILKDENSIRRVDPDDAYSPYIAIPPMSIWRFGLLPSKPKQVESASLILDQIQSVGTDTSNLPNTHDNSQDLPPVADQMDQNSCVAWAVGYYLKSYQEAKERGWSLEDPDHLFSPAFVYNQLQYYDEGSGFEESFDILLEQGCASLEMMPYDANHLTWPSANAYRDAIPFRASSYYYLGHGETPDIFECVKALLVSDDLCVVGVPVFTSEQGMPGYFESLSEHDTHYDLPLVSEGFIDGFQALTIVGYDETKFQGRGGYKVVNSWGTDWGNRGFAWLSETFLRSHGFGFYSMLDRIDYLPKAFLHIKMEHNYWYFDKLSATVGVGSTDSPDWSKLLNRHIPRNRLLLDKWIDITEGQKYLPPSLPDNQWWVRLEDHSFADRVTLYTLEIEVDGVFETAAPALPVSIGGFSTNTFHVYVPAGEAANYMYYVNDDAVSDDWNYCKAPGDDTHDGLTPFTPKRSIQEILNQYTLKEGDTIWIDAGTYDLNSAIVIDQLDRGQGGNPIRLVGAVDPNGELATIIRGPEGESSFSFYEHRFVQLENLWIRGGQDGIRCTYSRPYEAGNLVLQNLRISEVSQFGCYLRETNGIEIQNCIIYDCIKQGVRAMFSSITVTNSTVIAFPENDCIALTSGTARTSSNSDLILNNSILTTSGIGGECINGVNSFCKVSLAQYNDLVALEGGAIGFDANETNITEIPLFANPDIGDFHLLSSAGRWDPAAYGGQGGLIFDTLDSSCIDAGSFTGDYSLEPEPHGGRLNIGAFGGTAYASKSPVEGRYLFMDTPMEQTVCRYTCPIAWRCYGSGWKLTDTLSAEYSNDNGQAWHPIPDANLLPYRDMSYLWDVFTMPKGTAYTVRLVCNQDPNVIAYMEGLFTIDRPAFYYVNDGSLDNDVYCRSTGSDIYDGRSPDTPKATIKAIIDRYALEAGDYVYIDTGTYVQSENIVIGPEDSGDLSGQVRFVGSYHSTGSLINRDNTGEGSYGIHVKNSDYITLKNLKITGAKNGIWFENANYGTVQACHIYDNAEIGLKFNDSKNADIGQNFVYSNKNNGIILIRSQYAEIQNNFVYNNKHIGISVSSTSDLAEIVSNTVCLNVNGQITLASSSGNVVLCNNIVWADGPNVSCIMKSWSTEGIVSSDYNNLYTTDGAYVASYDNSLYGTLADWQSSTDFDEKSISTDPLFVDPWGVDGILGTEDDDWHLQSIMGSWHDEFWQADGLDSPCIDAGDPFDDVWDEPMPNGGRINMGAYGGTNQASKTSD